MAKPHFDLDYSLLETQKNPTYKYAEVKDRLERVAFDVVRFTDGTVPEDELWQVVSDSNGDYIVAKYSPDSSDETPKTASHSPWEVLTKAGSNEVQLFYKNIAITKFAHQNPSLLKRFLPKKLASNPTLLRSLLDSLSPSRKTELLTLFPELA